MTLSEAIRVRRRELNLTLKELAEKIGVSEATVQRYESGNIKNVRHERIVKIANALDMDPATLMGWEKEPPAMGGGGVMDEKTELLIELYESFDDERKEQLLRQARLLDLERNQ